MAYAPARSCNADLHAGMTDGAYKKAAPNRGGMVETTSDEVKRQMSGIWHGFNDSPAKMLPDGRSARVPYYADVASPEVREHIL